jgi:type IV fimbrial biogenesis protein FimT
MNILCKISPVVRHAAEKKQRAAGFTLIEILIVLSIVVVLVLIASPSFSYIMASRSAKSAASELFSSLQRARSEAIARDANVTLSPISGSWQNGWQVLSPTNTVLDNRSTVKGAIITGPASVVYRPSGRITATTVPSFLITGTSGATNFYQCVSVDLTGRPYSKAASSC